MSNFLERTIERAKLDRKRIVLAEGEDIRSIKAASIIVEKDICDVVLLGDIDKIKANAGDISLDGIEIINPETSPLTNNLIDKFYEIRKSKGLTFEEAENTIKNDYLYFGDMLVYMDYADGIVAGATQSSSDVLRAALKTVKTFLTI